MGSTYRKSAWEDACFAVTAASVGRGPRVPASPSLREERQPVMRRVKTFVGTLFPQGYEK